MLRLTLLTATLLAAATLSAAAPAPRTDAAAVKMIMDMMPILLDRRSMDEDGGYSYEVETADGQYRQEVGMILNKGTKDETKVVMGQYSFKDAFGKTKHYMYMADKNGYKVWASKRKENMSKALLSLLAG